MGTGAIAATATLNASPVERRFTMPEGERVRFRPSAVSTVLVRTAAETAVTRVGCLENFLAHAPPDRELIVLTSDPNPTTVVEEWDERVGLDPATFGVVAIGTSMRSETATAEGSSASARSTGTVTGSTRNLVRGVEDADGAMAVLTEWASETRETLVFADAVGSLVERLGRGRVVDLIDDVGALLADVGGMAGFRVDPQRVDDTTLAVFATVVDAVYDEVPDSAADDGPTETICRRFDGGPLALDGVFDALADRRRRRTLHLLREIGRPLTLESLAERLVAIDREGGRELPDAAVERTYVALAHVHVPRLADAGLVRFDGDAGTVGTARLSATLEPYLSIAATTDLPH